MTSTTSPGGDVLTYEYDTANRLSAIQNTDGERIEYDYDLMDNRTATRVKATGGAVARQASATFDDMGRLLKSLGAYVGEDYSFAYDGNGNTVSVTDPLANVTGYAFDALNRLVSTTDAGLGLATLAWDSSDNLDSATDQRSLSTTLVHNGFGDVIQYASPDSGTEIYEYDAAGNMTRRTDARGLVTDWTYDALGRPTAMSFPAAPAETVTYTYDDATPGHYGIGRLAGYADESGTTDYRYDARGNIVREDRAIGTQAYVSDYVWNDDGLLIQKTYPSGRIVDYTRNTRGQVTSVTTKANAGAPVVPVASAIAYEPFGPVKALTHGNGVTLDLAYDLDGRLSAMDAYNGATPVLDLDYTHDLAGNITDIDDMGGGSRGRNYAYDALHRLTQGQELAPGGGSVALQTDYTYDAVGNRATRTVGGSTETYSYDPFSNRLLSVLAGGVTRAFTWSASGNVTVDDAGGSAVTLTYNALDRLVRVSSGGIPLVDYVYAATGQRAIKATPLATTHYLHDPGGALQAETDGAGTTLREYITLGGATIAIVDSFGMSHVHDDHLGTPQAMTDGAAAVVWDASYRPFGEATIAGAAANQQRFPGQTADAETGYSDNWYRTYDASIGRYLQSDPIGLAGGWNSYGYVGGNPVMYMDPEGLRFWGPAGLIGAVGAAVAAVASSMGGRAAGGFVVGAGVDFGFQWATKGIRCINWTSVGISGAFGAAGAFGFPAAATSFWKRVGGFAAGSRGRANAAFAKGMEWMERSRFWPGKWGGPHSWWNQNLVPGTIHALTDPKRWRFLNKDWKNAKEMTKAFLNYSGAGFVLFRIPWWFEGAVAGGAAGATITSTECGCE